jgi:hypothetical protein
MNPVLFVGLLPCAADLLIYVMSCLQSRLRANKVELFGADGTAKPPGRDCRLCATKARKEADNGHLTVA